MATMTWWFIVGAGTLSDSLTLDRGELPSLSVAWVTEIKCGVGDTGLVGCEVGVWPVGDVGWD